MSAKSFWNDERDRELRRLHSEGLSCRKIGEALVISHVSVSNRMKILGIEPHAGRPVIRPKGARVKDAAAPDVSAPTVQAGCHVRPYQRARRGFEVPVHLEDRYFDLLKSGVPIAEACRQLGITKNH